MLVSHATVALNRLSQQQAYTGFMLTALYIAQLGASESCFDSAKLSDYVNNAFQAADRYR